MQRSGTPGSVFLQRAGRRRALRAVLLSSALWSGGSAVSAGFILRYWAQDLGAGGTGLAWIMALPSVLGLLRLAAPYLVALAGSARRLYLRASVAAYLLLAATVTLVLPPWAQGGAWALGWFVLLLTVHQVVEYVAGVGYWSWLGEVVPARLRGRFFGLRERIALLVSVPVALAVAKALDWWRDLALAQRLPISWGYAAAVLLGAGLFLASLVPMWLYVPCPPARISPGQAAMRWPAALQDRRFRALLYFGAWFSLANGITQAAQGRLPYVLGVELVWLSLMRMYLKLGQGALARPVGAWCDRWGNRPVMIASQVLVATSMLFYCLATAGNWWWLWGGWTAWVCYVGINVALPGVVLKLARGKENASYFATYFAVSGLVYAVSSMVGGVLLDALGERWAWVVYRWGLEAFGAMFLLGFVLRLTAALWLWRLREPGAWSWRNILRRLLALPQAANQPLKQPSG